MPVIEMLQLGTSSWASSQGLPYCKPTKTLCVITCTFVEVQTMSGYRFRVVLCDYERYIMSLYMYYRVVGKTLNVFQLPTATTEVATCTSCFVFELIIYKSLDLQSENKRKQLFVMLWWKMPEVVLQSPIILRRWWYKILEFHWPGLHTTEQHAAAACRR